MATLLEIYNLPQVGEQTAHPTLPFDHNDAGLPDGMKGVELGLWMYSFYFYKANNRPPSLNDLRAQFPRIRNIHKDLKWAKTKGWFEEVQGKIVPTGPNDKSLARYYKAELEKARRDRIIEKVETAVNSTI